MSSRRVTLLAAAVIVAATLAAWANSFHAPFVFDDRPAIVDNPTLHGPWTAALSPLPNGSTTAGRPLLNLSFDLNLRLGGNSVVGFHVVNLAIHLAAALTLFGLIRRLLTRAWDGNRAAATTVAGATALLWAVHPMQTESVTYLAQRAEALAGLSYLLMLYCFVAGVDADAADRGSSGHVAVTSRYVAAAACGVAGLLCKETLLTAPVVILMLDVALCSGSWRAAWRRRTWIHGALVSLWFVLAVSWLELQRGGTAGFSSGVSPLGYAATQTVAIVRHLQLVFWPHPLVFDYGATLHTASAAWLGPALFVASLITGSVWLWLRSPRLGCLAAAFFILLAPSSSIVPIASQTIAEHRMYLALALPILGFILLIHRWSPRGVLPVTLALAAVLATVTAVRNQDYASELGLWRDTVAKCPSNPPAHFNLGRLLAAQGDRAGGIRELRAAIALDDRNPEVELALGDAWVDAGQPADALVAFRRALALAPERAVAHFGAGNALAALHRPTEALAEYDEALRLRPGFALVHTNAGNVLLMGGQPAAAVARYQAALALEPDSATAHFNLASALAQQGAAAAALEHYHSAVRLRPDFADAHYNLGNLLLERDRAAEAIPEFQAVLQHEPPTARVLDRLGCALATAGRAGDAQEAFVGALRLDDKSTAAQADYGSFLAQLGRVAEALPHFQTAVALDGRNVMFRLNLANALVLLDRRREAQREADEVLRLDPANADARELRRQLDASTLH